MLPQEVYLKYTHLLQSLDLPELADHVFLKAIKTGALNAEGNREDADQMAKIILHIVFCQLAEKFKPVEPVNIVLQDAVGTIKMAS